MRAASTRPNTSGCSVSASPITSSLIQFVAKISRAICAVVTASFTEWQPAVLGRTRTPSSRISVQKSWPSRRRADSRRNETVTISALDARTASARMAGDGYCAVPSRRRDWISSSYNRMASAPLPRRDDLDPVALGELDLFALARRHEMAVQRRGHGRVLVFERLQRRRERRGGDLMLDAVDDDPHG